MHLHALLLLGAGAAFLGFLPAANALVQLSNEPRIISPASSAEKSRVPSTVPCPEDLRRIEYEPLAPGPARLTAIRCLDLPRGQEYRLRPVVSPDGHSVAFWSSGQDSPLDVLSFDGSPGFRLSNRATFRHFGSGVDDDRQQAIAWRWDGSGLWSVEQQVARPSARPSPASSRS